VGGVLLWGLAVAAAGRQVRHSAVAMQPACAPA
jgi:hypothetical protein